MASTSPARASRTASSTAWPAIRPASSGRRERRACSPLPTITTSASSAPKASAFSTTSGPMPRGSPSVTASRGATPLEPDVDVGGAAQQVEVVLDGELLRQAVADAVLDLVERQVALGEPPDQLEYDEARPRGTGAHLEDGLEARHRVAAHDLLVVGRELRHGQCVGQLGRASAVRGIGLRHDYDLAE